MILARYYTDEEPGNWKPIPVGIQITKETIEMCILPDGFEYPSQRWPISFGNTDQPESYQAVSIMFEDGSIYDAYHHQFRHVRIPEFTQASTIEYMNNILNKSNT